MSLLPNIELVGIGLKSFLKLNGTEIGASSVEIKANSGDLTEVVVRVNSDDLSVALHETKLCLIVVDPKTKDGAGPSRCSLRR